MQSVLARQLWVSADQRLFVADKSNPDKSQLTAWTAMAQKYTRKDVTMQINNTEYDVECYVVVARRGSGCNVIWKAGDFYDGVGVQGYIVGGSKWVYVRWKFWQAATNKEWPGEHFSNDTASKKASEVAVSDTVFLPSAGMTTMAAMVMMHRWAFAKSKYGEL